MARIPAALHKRKKKKKKSGKGAITTYLDFGSILHKRIENKLVDRARIKADKISEQHIIEDLVAPLKVKENGISIPQSVKNNSQISTTTSSTCGWIDISDTIKNKPVSVDHTFEKFKRGDRVILIESRHGNSDVNPFYKGEYACSGTLKGPGEKYGWVAVKWDNGYMNNYKLKDLDFDNLAKCKSIW